MVLTLTLATIVGGLLPLVGLAQIVCRSLAAERRLERSMRELAHVISHPQVGRSIWHATSNDLDMEVMRQRLLAAREVRADLTGPTALVVVGALISTAASTVSLYV